MSKDTEHGELLVEDLIKFAEKYKKSGLYVDDGVSVERAHHLQIRMDTCGNTIVVLSHRALLK